MNEEQLCFRALADPSRRDILMHLSGRDMSISELADKFDVTRAAVKKHLVMLEQGRMISSRKHGRERINHLEPEGLIVVANWLEYFSAYWDTRLAKLQSIVEKEKGEQKK